MDLINAFPEWKNLSLHYVKNYKLLTMYFYRQKDAVRTYSMLADAGYRVSVEINKSHANVVSVWVKSK